jgi:hypothetical protein
MTIYFQKTLQEAMEAIEHTNYHDFPIFGDNRDELIEIYGKMKWEIVDLLNDYYNHILKDKFDLYNWLNHNTNDELAYFLNESGSNALSYSDNKVPNRFHLWLGTKGFIVGIEQTGKGFNAQEVDEKKIKENEGSGFTFFRDCQSGIFFDDPKESKIVFMEFQFL